MTTDIATLFGLNPQMYEQNVSNQALDRGTQLGQLDPGAFARANLYASGAQLGRGIGSMLGAEDPQLKIIALRQQVLQNTDMTDPQAVQRAMQALAQQNDQAGAIGLADRYRQLNESQALINLRNRERAGVDPIQQLLRSGKFTAQSVSDYDKSGNIKDLREIDKLPKEPTPLDIQKAQEYRQSLIDAKAPPAQIAEVDAYIRGISTGKGAQITNVLPGAKELVDIPAFRAKVQSTIEPQSKVVFATDNALTAINDSIATDNFASFRAAKTQFARAISGAGDLSQRELKAAGADPSLLGGSADYISELFTSTPTLDTQNKIKKTLEAIRTVSVRKANAEIQRQEKIALLQPGYSPAAVATALDFPEFKQPTAAPSAGGPFNDAEKERRYQEWKKGGKP